MFRAEATRTGESQAVGDERLVEIGGLAVVEVVGEVSVAVGGSEPALVACLHTLLLAAKPPLLIVLGVLEREDGGKGEGLEAEP